MSNLKNNRNSETVKITISGDFEQSMAQRRRMFQSQWRPNIYFS